MPRYVPQALANFKYGSIQTDLQVNVLFDAWKAIESDAWLAAITYAE